MENVQQIKRHSLKSVKWVAFGFILPKLITPIVTIILAKLLSPADFGIISICSVFIGIINLVQGLGLNDFIIKEPENNEVYLSTAFWSSLGLSIIVSGLMWGAAPLIAQMYNEPLMAKALPILALAVVFNGAGTIQSALLQKEMKFKSLFKVQILPMFVSLCITLPMAYLGYGVWSLIAGELSKSFLTNVAYWLIEKWVPRFTFSGAAFKQMMKFGGWIITEKVQEYLYSNLDRIFLGYFANLSVLGVYTIARQIIFVIYNAINGPIGGIVFPMLSKLQTEAGKIKNGFLEVSKRVMLVNIPVAVASVLFSFIVIPLPFSNKWEGLALVFCIGVAGEGIARMIWAQREMFKILNRPDVYPKAVTINLLFAAVCYPFGAMHGLIIFCVVRALNDVLYTVVQVLLTSRILGFKVMEFFRLSYTALFSSLGMAAAITAGIFIVKWCSITFTVIPVLLLVMISLISYVLIFRTISRDDFEKMWVEMKVILGFS